MDAANVDLKGFSEHFYHKICHGELAPVLDTLCYLKQETNVWFEITTLLIPGENDSDGELHQLSQWLAENLGLDIPLHFTAFHPDFKMMDKAATSLATLLRARAIALSYGLHYVYCGNVHHSISDSTFCQNCGHLLIERDWYQIRQYTLNDSGHCRHCHHPLPGRFASKAENFGRRRIPIQIVAASSH
jgi:pyruvate formate lyase activating enzyme